MDRDKDVKTIFQQYIYGMRSDIYSTYIAMSLCILPYRSKLWGLTVSKSTKSYCPNYMGAYSKRTLTYNVLPRHI